MDDLFVANVSGVFVGTQINQKVLAEAGVKNRSVGKVLIRLVVQCPTW
jgi:hypothetical protein